MNKFSNYVKIRYGREDNLPYNWKDIISKKTKKEMHKCIDELTKRLNENTAQNGFFGNNDIVDCGQGRGFYLDDKNLYYEFFRNLKKLYNENQDKKSTDGAYISAAIRYTIQQYAGGNGVDREKRLSLTELEHTDNDIRFPSISKQKGQNCFYCTERSAISHNLWLMAGVTSYFCFTWSDNFGETDPTYANDTHNFNIVENNGKFRLYDISMNNFCKLQSDCIENMLNGKGLEVENVANPGVYVKNSLVNDLGK